MKRTKLGKNRKVFIIQTILFLLSFLLITGCSGRQNISSATLLGYDGISFEETMSKFTESMKAEAEAEGYATISCGWQDGWVGDNAPIPKALVNNEKPMTYIVSINLSSYGESETNRVIFYMIHNTKENTLSVQGGVWEEDDDIYPMSLDEARDSLKSIFDEYN